MPAGQLFFYNRTTQEWDDAYTNYGISMDSTALSALMTPAAQKEVITSKSRLQHGTKIVNNNPKKDERSVTLTINLIASSENDFFTKYNAFCNLLATGYLDVKTSFQPTVAYRFIYLSCNQFTQFVRGIAKFSLRLTEPDPTNRSV